MATEMITSKNAELCFCPQKFANVDGDTQCVGHNCMAWRYDNAWWNGDEDLDLDDAPGYCGIMGNN